MFKDLLSPHKEEVRSGSVVEIIRKFEKRKLLPLGLKEYSSGMGAITRTSECATPNFFTSITYKYHPNGYIVGVGAGAIFSLINCFAERDIPKGIVIVDINPQIVANSLLLVETLKKNLTPDQFRRNYFEQSDKDFQRNLLRILDKNPILKRRIKEVPGGNIFFPRPMTTSKLHESSVNPKTQDIIDVEEAVLRNLPVLQGLAKNNNLVAVYADFLNPELVNNLIKLPGIKEFTNIFYLSNLTLFLTRLGHKPDELRRMEVLRAYENLPRTQVFIDAINSHNLYLEAHTSLPIRH